MDVFQAMAKWEFMPELAFFLVKNPLLKENFFLLEIKIGEKIGGLFHASDKGVLSEAHILKLSKENEKPLVKFLIEQRKKFLTLHKTLLLDRNNTFEIPIETREGSNALKLLAATGKFYLGQRQIFTDFFTCVDLFYRLEKLDGKTVRIFAMIKWNDKEFTLHEADIVSQGSPPWLIKNGILKFFQDNITWKQIKKFINSPLEASIDQLSSFFEDYLEDPSSHPKVEDCEGLLLTPEGIPEPLPVLKLKDKTGAFADLYMDYGHHLVGFYEVARNNLEFNCSEPFKRNLAIEKIWEKDLLETDYIKKQVGNSFYHCPLDKVAKSLSFLLEIGWRIIDHKDCVVKRLQENYLSLEEQRSQIIVRGRIHFENFEANIQDVVGAFNRRERFIQLGTGVVGLLPNTLEESHLPSYLSEMEVVSDGIRTYKHRIGNFLDSHDHQHTHISFSNSLLALKKQINDLQEIQVATVGDTFQGKLRPYQQFGVNWLNFLYCAGFHGILADDMGLGKTAQVLAFLSQLKLTHPILVIVPTSLIFNWKNEIQKFLPNFSFYIHYGPKRSQDPEVIKEHMITLTTYSLLRLDLQLFGSLHFQAIILDEAQAIKTSSSQISQAVRTLSSEFRLSMTGTPIENSLQELFSHFHFLMPSLLGEEKQFLQDAKASFFDSRYLQNIRKRITPFILRRKKEDVAQDLPDKIEQIVFIEMGSDERSLYEKFIAQAKQGLLKKVKEEGIEKHRMEIFELILRLKQFCCHPLLLSSIFGEEVPKNSAKMEQLLQDLETIHSENKKVLVYSQFTSVLTLIARELKKREWKFSYLDGSTRNREEVVSQFQKDEETLIFLISLKAGGVGLNLTRADYVLLYDPWWNESVENQAIDRAHRLGRKDVVIAKRYITQETIEEKIMKLKAYKKSLASELIEDISKGENLSIKDLEFLLTEMDDLEQ